MTDGVVDRSGRWRIATAATAILAAVGVLTGRGAFLLAGIVPLTYVAMVNATGVSEPDVVVERSVDPEQPLPGDEVTVTVEVENVGENVLADLRIVDGVPSRLAVVGGSPRAAVGLRPGHTEAFEYVVTARRGTHDFDRPRVRVRSLTGGDRYTGNVPQRGDQQLRCELGLDELPLREQTIAFFGRIPTDTPGSGLEFHSTREYRPGDRTTRINWRRYAETGELTTVEFRESRATTVVLVIDARQETDIASAPGQPSAVEYALYAADRAVTALRTAGNRVGLTALGASVDWVEPTDSRDIERRFDHVAEAVAPRGAGDQLGADGGRPVSQHSNAVAQSTRQLCQRLPPEAQVVLLTPAIDSGPVEATRVLGAYGHSVTVLSPDPTAGDSPGQRLASFRRATRLVRLREADARVVDWDPEDPLSVALGEALQRWVNR